VEVRLLNSEDFVVFANEDFGIEGAGLRNKHLP
jgi:hypothetical protein